MSTMSTMNKGMNYNNQNKNTKNMQYTEDEVKEAKESLKGLQMKMGGGMQGGVMKTNNNQNNFNQNNNQGTGNYRRPFKPEFNNDIDVDMNKETKQKPFTSNSTQKKGVNVKVTTNQRVSEKKMEVEEVKDERVAKAFGNE